MSLFGSAARGDGDRSSDLDLFVVRARAVAEDDARWRAQVAELGEKAQRWTGNRASVAEVPERALGRLRGSRPAIVANLERDAIHLCGRPVSDLLRAAR